MYFVRILLSIFIFIFIGVIFSLLYIKIGDKDLFGGKKFGMIVGVTGGILGGFVFDLLFKIPPFSQLVDTPYIQKLLVNQFDINFLATFLGIWTFLLLYDYVSRYTERS